MASEDSIDYQTSGVKTKRKLKSHLSNTSLFVNDAKVKMQGLQVMFQCEIEDEKKEHNVLDDTVSERSTLAKQLIISDSLFCNCCQISFAVREEQLIHYKCDWHRYNLHLRLKGIKSVTEEEFEFLSGDVSSISGSEEESEDDPVELNEENIVHSVEIIDDKPESVQKEHGTNKVYFKNDQGELISLYKCLLCHKKSQKKSSQDLQNVATQLSMNPKWTVLMVSSGHFAGAIFDGKDVLDHKTFHRYTIRAKRGTAQSAKDGQGNAPKSAGASLRRYNEAALNHEVQDYLKSWKNHLDTSSLIFVRIPISNRVMFYGGKYPVLMKDDLRIRVIPFPTRRPTYSEVKRVHQMLSNIESYGKDELDCIPLSPQRFYCKDKDELEIKTLDQRQKESPKKEGSQSKKVKEIKDLKDIKGSIAFEDNELDLNPVGPGIPLKELEINVGKKKRRKPNFAVSKIPPDNPVSKRSEGEVDVAIKNSLFTACKAGSKENLNKGIILLRNLFTEKGVTKRTIVIQDESKANEKSTHNQNDTQDRYVETLDSDTYDDQASNYVGNSHIDQLSAEFLSCSIGENTDTLLHISSKGNHHELVSILLQEGANPAVKNKDGKVPYLLGNNEVKNTYRRFMAQFPDRYNYKEAQIPGPLTPEMEVLKKQKTAEKRALKKKTMQEKNKTKKEEEMKLRQEKEMKEKFLSLSDREKRALAAEKRLLQQSIEQGNPTPVLSRCYQCGADITGKVPFEYSDFKFCTTKCLRDHRSKPKS